MSRSMKIPGLVLIAMLLLNAICASSASATTFHLTTETDNTTLTAETLTNQVFTTPTGSFTCERLTTNTTVGTNETNEITAINLAFEGNCTVAIGSTTVPLDVFMNGCDFLYTINEELEAGHKWIGTVHLKCPAGKQVELKATVGGIALNCEDVHEQTPTESAIYYINEGSGTTRDIRVKSVIEGVTSEKTGACGSGEINNILYSGEVAITGEDAAKNHVGITVS